MRKFIFAAVVLIIAGAIAWRLFVTAAPKAGRLIPGKAPIAVECATAKLGNIDDISEFTGTLAGKAEVLVSPKISGRIH